MYSAPCNLTTTQFWNPELLPSILRSQISIISNVPLMTIQCLADITNSYQTENVLIPFGDDFSFQNAEETYSFISNIT